MMMLLMMVLVMVMMMMDGDGDGDGDDGDGDDYDGDGGQLLRRPMALVMAKFSLQLHPICHTCIHEADSGDNRI